VGIAAVLMVVSLVIPPVRGFFHGPDWPNNGDDGPQPDDDGWANGPQRPPTGSILLILLILMGEACGAMANYTMGLAMQDWQTASIVLTTYSSLIAVPGLVFG
jgi:hypothetical protein